MPVTLKHLKMKVKDATTGEYQAVDIMSDATLAERVAALGEAAETQIDSIEDAGDAQIEAVQEAGQDVIESLPEDFTELEEDVTQLSNAINEQASALPTKATTYSNFTTENDKRASISNNALVLIDATGYCVKSFACIPGDVFYITGLVDVNSTMSTIYVKRDGTAERKTPDGSPSGSVDKKFVVPDDVIQLVFTSDKNVTFSAKKETFVSVLPEAEFYDVFPESNNILNPDTVSAGYYVNQANGQLVSNNTYTASDYIPIKQNTRYILSETNVNGTQVADVSSSRWCIYDENRTFLAGFVNNAVVNPAQTGVTLATGETAETAANKQRYLRISYQAAHVGEQVQEGEIVSPYVVYGKQLDPDYAEGALAPLNRTINSDDIVPTTFGENIVGNYVMGAVSADFSVVNGEYVNMDDGDGVYHYGYLLETPLNTSGENPYYENAEIQFKFPATVNKWYLLAASVPYVANPGPGGRDRFDFEIDFGKQSEFTATTGIEYRDGTTDETTNSYRYITFGNNDANFCVMWKCKYVDENGYAYVRFGAARNLQIVRNASTRKITARTWDGVSYRKWRGQIIHFDVREIFAFTPALLNKTVAVGDGNGISSTHHFRLQNNNFAIGTDGHSKLFADNGWKRNSYDGVETGKSTAGNDKPATGNVGIGARTQNDITTAFYNVGMGYNAQSHLTNGSMNVSVGRAAGEMITGGMFNHSFGQAAGGCLENGSWNVSIGNEAHKMLVEGNNNVAIGRRAHNSLEDGNYNTVVGSRAGFYPWESRNAEGQTLIGFEACRPRFAEGEDRNKKSMYPTAVGANSRAGDYAVAVGAFAEANGKYSVAIGGGGYYDAGEDAHGKVTASHNGCVVIGVDSNGNGAQSIADDQIVIGTSAQTVILAGKLLTFNNDGTVTWESLETT